MNKQLSPEMVAFNSLTAEERELVMVSPKDSVLKKEKVNSVISSLIDKNYKRDIVYSVTFDTEDSDKPGILIVFLSENKKTSLGKLFIGQLLRKKERQYIRSFLIHSTSKNT